MSDFMRDTRRVHASVTTPEFVATAGNQIYVSVPKAVTDEVVLKRLRIIGETLTATAGDILDIKIVDDAAGYRAALAATTSDNHVVFGWNDQPPEEGPNFNWVSDITFSDDVIYSDTNRSNNLYLLITAPNGINTNTTFLVDFWGDQLPMQNYSFESGHKADQTHPLVYRENAAGNWKKLDVANLQENSNMAVSLFQANTDKIYFGLPKPWEGLWFNLAAAASDAGLITTWKYYNGSTWAALTVKDNCTDYQSVLATQFAYSGVIDWDAPSAWRPTMLWDAVETYYAPPYGDSLYWVSMEISDYTIQPTFKWIRRKPLP